MSTDIKRLQQKKIDDATDLLPVYFAAALRRWKNLQPSLRLRKLDALVNFLCRDIEAHERDRKERPKP